MLPTRQMIRTILKAAGMKWIRRYVKNKYCNNRSDSKNWRVSLIMNHIAVILIIELIGIGILLYFNLKYSKERRLWIVNKEKEKKKEKEDLLLRELSNDKRMTTR